MQQHNLEKPTAIEAAVNEVVVFKVAFATESKIQICRCFCSIVRSKSVDSRSRSTTTTGREICDVCR
ncbi:hypothetical protein CsSME_00006581 [Camellia sinensis var. sinensis]